MPEALALDRLERELCGFAHAAFAPPPDGLFPAVLCADGAVFHLLSLSSSIVMNMITQTRAITKSVSSTMRLIRMVSPWGCKELR
jgi:hypothetical protein